jgi:hypothetical protein
MSNVEPEVRSPESGHRFPGAAHPSCRSLPFLIIHQFEGIAQIIEKHYSFPHA